MNNKFKENSKELKGVIGYKVFKSDWTCRGFQYEVGKTFEEDVTPSCCNRGFHFCRKLSDCFNYYRFDPNNKVAKIIALGEIDEPFHFDDQHDSGKCCTNKIQIVEEISWEKVLKMVNLGEKNTGLCNSGNYNSGCRNSGNRNSGNCNSGNDNSGNNNSGDNNSGDNNSGDNNDGNRNSGYRNSGNDNSGNYNSGDNNSGNCNSGNDNSGNDNSGNYNSGDCNSGNRNSGDYNSGDYNSGIFNTDEPFLRMFNRKSNWKRSDWDKCDAKLILNTMPIDGPAWVTCENMTLEERESHPEFKTMNGYLKHQEGENHQKWWDKLSKYEKEEIMSLPNFDADIFKEITSIDVNDN